MRTAIKRYLFFVLWLVMVQITGYGQMNYIGLKDEANIRIAQEALQDINGSYWAKLQNINDTVYIPTINGIYQKDLATLDNTDWELYAFEGVAVRDFIKKGDTILVATAVYSDENILLLSTDNGKSYIDYTHPHFFEGEEEEVSIIQLTQNPQNHNTTLALYLGYGVSISYDFGKNWTLLNNEIGGGQDWFLEYHPKDTTNIFYTGESMYSEAYIRATYDSGTTWEKVDALHSNCTHGIAFHPTDKNTMISYGEGLIKKSTNQGLTWTLIAALNIYIFKMLYDTKNPNILYASGVFNGESNLIQIFRSIDGGNSWHLFYEEAIENADGVMDIHLYGDKLIIYTLTNGVYYLDVNKISVENSIIVENGCLRIYPTVASSFIAIESNCSQIENIRLFDISGRFVREFPFVGDKAEINISSLYTGVYYLSVSSGYQTYTEKIVKINH